ncbi:MAG: hypothetical protein PVG03_18260, partial [Desulfarculaceae bacterium]
SAMVEQSTPWENPFFKEYGFWSAFLQGKRHCLPIIIRITIFYLNGSSKEKCYLGRCSSLAAPLHLILKVVGNVFLWKNPGI